MDRFLVKQFLFNSSNGKTPPGHHFFLGPSYGEIGVYINTKKKIYETLHMCVFLKKIYEISVL